MKISEEVFKQIKARENALQSVQILFAMAQNEYNIFIREQIKTLGLDENKVYKINDSLEILEVKEELVEDQNGSNKE